jgi:hypothetical protein
MKSDNEKLVIKMAEQHDEDRFRLSLIKESLNILINPVK